MPALRCVLFDLGNVLLMFSNERKHAQLAEVSGLSPVEVVTVLTGAGRQDRYERGELSTGAFFAPLLAAARKPCTLAEACGAFSDIFTLNASLLPLLAALRAAGVRLVLVSNTCEAHIEFARRQWRFLDDFAELVLSFEIGVMKPDAGFYHRALVAAQTTPDACLFVDDLPVNVAAAMAAGLPGVVFTDSEALRRELAVRGIG